MAVLCGASRGSIVGPVWQGAIESSEHPIVGPTGYLCAHHREMRSFFWTESR